MGLAGRVGPELARSSRATPILWYTRHSVWHIHAKFGTRPDCRRGASRMGSCGGPPVG